MVNWNQDNIYLFRYALLIQASTFFSQTVYSSVIKCYKLAFIHTHKIWNNFFCLEKMFLKILFFKQLNSYNFIRIEVSCSLCVGFKNNNRIIFSLCLLYVVVCDKQVLKLYKKQKSCIAKVILQNLVNMYCTESKSLECSSHCDTPSV